MQEMTASSSDVVRDKVAFRLTRDDEGYPPADWEHLWVQVLGENEYLIDNSPFFVPGISVGDVVAAEREAGLLVYDRLLRRSAHSTIRVILFDPALTDQVRLRLGDLGCATELSHIPGLMAVDVPPDVPVKEIRAFLNKGEEEGSWQYEESALRHPD